jgi:hypothetical protein
MNSTLPQSAPHVLSYPIVRPVPRPAGSALDSPGLW